MNRSVPASRARRSATSLHSATTLAQLQDLIAAFVRERDWEQFHSPKNLAMSIAVEAAELMELFQWEEGRRQHHALRRRRREVEDELADIAMFLLEFCRLYRVDLGAAIVRKLAANARKYPIHLAKGQTHKYTAYLKARRRSRG